MGFTILITFRPYKIFRTCELFLEQPFAGLGNVTAHSDVKKNCVILNAQKNSLPR